ncbi:MAG: hypothetical protein LJF06_02195 [Gemmatimonadetes bacterium]|nr:hypothetical protein [Gemmatimonadota bacterium]
MGSVWVVLFVVGLLIPLFALVGTGILVVRWSQRIQGLDPGAPPPWQYLLLHLATVVGGQLVPVFLLDLPGFGILVASGVLTLVAMTVVPYRLRARLVRLTAGALGEPPPPVPATPVASTETRRKRPWGLATLFVLTGVLVPWVTAVGVKLYLDANGRPTLPFSDFLGLTTVVVLLALTLTAWAFPFLLLATTVLVPLRFGLGVDPSARGGRLPVWLAFAAGVLAGVPVYISVFWEFDTMYLKAPLGLLLLVPMMVPYLIDVAGVRRRLRASGSIPTLG